MNTVLIASQLLLSALTVYQTDPFSHTVYSPTNRHPSAVETKTVRAYAAKGEIDCAAFQLTSESDLSDFLLTPTDLKGPGGAVIPAAEVDIRVVKIMYSPDCIWFSTWRGNQSKPVLYNDLLVHDDGLLVVDDEKKRNFLRVDYEAPVGTRYLDCREQGRAGEFNDTVEPVRDSERMVPMKLLAKGRYGYFWLTFRIREDAKSGVYRGKLAVSSSGRDLGSIGLELEVYPFSLPEPRVHYALDRPFMMGLYGSPTLKRVLEKVKDLPRAEKRYEGICRNLKEHGITSTFGVGERGFGDADDLANNLELRDLLINRHAGLPMRPIFGYPGGATTGWACPPGRKKPDYDEHPEELKKSIAGHKLEGEIGAKVLDRYLGHHEAFAFNPDECGSFTYFHNMPFADNVYRNGGMTYGDYADPHENGWTLSVNSIAADCSHRVTWAWHNCGAMATTYATPFYGAVCPDTYRRHQGFRNWIHDHDGVTNYSFEGGLGHNRWNKFAYHNTGYGQFGIVYADLNGLLDTCAWEGVREGIDDIRYCSLLLLRAKAAMASKDAKTVSLGRDTYIWFESQDPERLHDMNAFRREVAGKIVKLIEAVGPETSRLPECIPPVKLPRPTYGDDDGALIATNPVAVIEKYEKADRWDLALPLALKTGADKAKDEETRFTALVKAARYLCYYKRRAEGLRLLEGLAAERGHSPGMLGRLELALSKAILREQIFEEKFTDEQLAQARGHLDKAMKNGALPTKLRGDAMVDFARACRDSDAFQLGVDFLAPYMGNKVYTDFESAMRAWRARCYYGLKNYDRAVADFKIVAFESKFDHFSILEETGLAAEALEDYETANKAYTMWFPMIDKEEDKARYMRCQASIIRCSEKLRKNARKKPVSLDFNEDDSDGLTLDE